MKPKLVVIDTPQSIEELREYLRDKEYIAFDTETTGLNRSDEIIGISVCASEDIAYYVVLAKWNPILSTLVRSDAAKAGAAALVRDLLVKNVICHNGTFDCMMAEAFFKVRLIDALHTDTLILAHLLDENRRVGLKELGASMFGEDATDEAKEMKESVAKNGGSLTKANYEMYKADSDLMGKYGAKDAWLTYKLFLELVPELYAQNLDQFFYEDESMPLLKGPTYDLNTVGLSVDQKALTSLKKQLEAECHEAKAFIHHEIQKYVAAKYPGTTKKNHFNIGSSSQLSWLLFGEMGLEFNTLTAEGKNVCKELLGKLPYQPAAKRQFIAACLRSKDGIFKPEATVNGKKVRAKKYKDPWSYIACDKKTLQKYAPKFKWIEALLEYQRKTKLLTTYVEGLEERLQYGVIHPSFLQHGTTSGRYSSRNPNFQNMPRDDKRIKQCVVARPGKVFVGADYSQLEPRVFAYFSGDKRLLEVFNGITVERDGLAGRSDARADTTAGRPDFYSVIGMEVYGKWDCTPHKDGSDEAFGVKYKRLRDLSKVIALASTYGATAHQLASTTGKSAAETQDDIDNYFERFPGVAQMMLSSHNYAKTHGFVQNLFGRKRRMPEAKKIDKIYGRKPHAELPYEARNTLNLAVNHVIQSTGASICNRAAIRFLENIKNLNINAKLVVQVHDSLVAECAEADAETVSLLLEDAMINTVKLEGIELEAIPKIGKNLSEV